MIHFLKKQLTYFTTTTHLSSDNLSTVYSLSKQTKTPFFTTQSHHIEIIDDPLQFYLNLHRQSKKAIHRIGISSLYLGTGSLQRFLFNSIIKRVKDVPSLNVNMVFDYNRSLRPENGESSAHMMNSYLDQQLKKRIKIGLHKQSSSSHKIMGEVSGVHHQKIAIFDDTIIIGGANLSHNYFVNRRDRYMKLKQCSELGDYLYDYITVMAQNGYQMGSQKPYPPQNPNLLNHYKLWKFSYTPIEYKQTLKQQEDFLLKIKQEKQFQMNRQVEGELKKKIPKSRNVILSQLLGTDIQVFQQVQQQKRIQMRENVREKLFSVHDENDVGNYIMDYQYVKSKEQDITEIGEKVYIFPFIQHPHVGEKQEPQVLQAVLENSVQSNFPIRFSSGYMNFTPQILNCLSKSKTATQILCSAPQANSFFRGGTFKKFIPYFYRNFQGMILSKWPDKFRIKQYFDGKWSFHAKGMWIKQTDNTQLTIIGSSNFNHRSKERDTQLQLYLYSTCPQFNYRLDQQWSKIEKHCKIITLNEIKNDKEIKFNWWFNMLAKILSKFL